MQIHRQLWIDHHRRSCLLKVSLTIFLHGCDRYMYFKLRKSSCLSGYKIWRYLLVVRYFSPSPSIKFLCPLKEMIILMQLRWKNLTQWNVVKKSNVSVNNLTSGNSVSDKGEGMRTTWVPNMVKEKFPTILDEWMSLLVMLMKFLRKFSSEKHSLEKLCFLDNTSIEIV